MPKHLSPIFPGEILLEEFLKPMRISERRLARETRLSRRHVRRIVRGEHRITRDAAERFAAFFRTSSDFWINLQSRFDAK